jgi:hypothetical protein
MGAGVSGSCNEADLTYCCGRCGQRPGARLADAILGAAGKCPGPSTCRTPSAHGHPDRARCLGRSGPARGITQRHRALSRRLPRPTTTADRTVTGPRRPQPARADLPRPQGSGTGGPPTSTAVSWLPPTRSPGGATSTATAPGPGTACGTCSAPPPKFTWKLDATDVSRMAGHANYRITLDMYVGTTAGVLDRARQATQ